MFPVPNITKMFAENGTPLNKDIVNQRAAKFIQKLKWFIEAKNRMNL
jgi:hypothetical protein